MSVLVDSNVLLRGVDPGDPDHQVALDAVGRLLAQGEIVYVALQNLCEAWRGMTGAKGQNGLGLPVVTAAAEIDRFEPLFTLLLEDVPAIYVEWKRLVRQHQVVGLDVYDARLAAAMIVHKIDHILTFDAGFARYGVTVLDPATV